MLTEFPANIEGTKLDELAETRPLQPPTPQLKFVKRNVIACPQNRMTDAYENKGVMIRYVRFKNRCVPVKHFNHHLIQACQKLVYISHDADMKSFCLMLLNKLMLPIY